MYYRGSPVISLAKDQDDVLVKYRDGSEKRYLASELKAFRRQHNGDSFHEAHGFDWPSSLLGNYWPEPDELSKDTEQRIALSARDIAERFLAIIFNDEVASSTYFPHNVAYRDNYVRDVLLDTQPRRDCAAFFSNEPEIAKQLVGWLKGHWDARTDRREVSRGVAAMLYDLKLEDAKRIGYLDLIDHIAATAEDGLDVDLISFTSVTNDMFGDSQLKYETARRILVVPFESVHEEALEKLCKEHFSKEWFGELAEMMVRNMDSRRAEISIALALSTSDYDRARVRSAFSQLIRQPSRAGIAYLAALDRGEDVGSAHDEAEFNRD